MIEFSEGSSKKLRLLETSSCKIMQLVNENTSLQSLGGAVTKGYRIEEIPIDQLSLDPNEFFVPVAHFQKEPYQTFGVPFLVKIRDVSLKKFCCRFVFDLNLVFFFKLYREKVLLR